MLCLDMYANNLLKEGFTSVEQMTDITWEDLEDIGIHKLGITCHSQNSFHKLVVVQLHYISDARW